MALVVLSLFPLVAGSLRLVEVGGGPQLLPTNPRIDASPAPLVVHVLAAAIYAVLGAFQFPARLAVAGSGLWMTLFYRGAPGGDLLWSVRLLVGFAMAASIVLGFAAIRRSDIAAHRAWMIRATPSGSRPSVRRAAGARARAAVVAAS